MDYLLRILFLFLNNPLSALVLAFCLYFLNSKTLPISRKLIKAGVLFTVFTLLFFFLSLEIKFFRLLEGMNSPLVPSILLLVFPALMLRKSQKYKLFLLLPIFVIISSVISVFMEYNSLPFEDRFFAWILIPPEFLFASLVSFCILAETFMSLNSFRYFVRITAFIVLIFGGFMFRKNFADYKEMLSRRKSANTGMMMLSETQPVLSVKDDANYSYLPSAPCRFAPDGGYVQGCNMEMFQRFMQIHLGKIFDGDLVEMRSLAKLFGALVFFLALSMICARWFCGWICPLSTAGDILDRLRRLLNLPYFKASQPVKIGYFLSGFSIASFGLLLAKLYPHIDENGKFMGCKIPIFPFCKICPAQQICPTFAGISNYPPIPGWEWVFGFYRIFTLLILLFFVASFAIGRRIWCIFCPMGMISGIFNRGGIPTLRKNPIKCNSCGVCYDVCPMHIDSVRAEMKDSDVSSYDCVLCLKCVEKCPQDKCLSFEFAGEKITESKFK